MDLLGLRPLRVGEVLDLGIKIYRRRFGALVRAVAVVVVPVSVVTAVVSISASVSDTEEVDGGDIGAFFVANLVTGLLGLLASLLATAASFEIVSADYLGEERTWQESLRKAGERFWSLVWLSFLFGIVVGLGLMLCLLPGIYFAIVFSVSVPVLLFEGVRGKAALGRSKRLLAGRFWPTLAVLLVGYLLVMVLTSALQGLVLAAASGNETVDVVGGGIIGAVSSCLTTPFIAALLAVLYFDARVRKEGFDLELLARQIGIEPVPGSLPTFAPEPVSEEQPPFWPPPPGWRPGGQAPDA